MLVNPYAERLLTYGGTRLLQKDFGLVGTILPDPFNKRRLWTIQGLYAPIPGRSLGGVRAKLQDRKGFISFLNQMDMEILLGIAVPGKKCRWSGKEYAEVESPNFFGFCCDDDDLLDDLYDRELMIRGETGLLPYGAEVLRRIHYEDRVDYEELRILLQDVDPDTGIGPDMRIDTIERRWVRVERNRLPWEDA
jgi:hypothetical protein